MILLLAQILSDKAPLRIRTARVLNQRIHVDRKRITHPPDLQVLIKRVLITIFGQNPDVTFTVTNLVLASGVIGNICVRDVLDVTHNSIKYLGDLDISVIVHRDDLAAGTVLSLVIGHLPNVLR